MAFCKNCGTQIPDGTELCQNCANQGAANNFQNAANNVVNDFTNPTDETGAFDPADIEATKIMSLFAYLGILFLIPLLACKDSAFARFHANQGIVLFILGIIGGVVAVIPFLGWILSGAVGIFSLVLTIMGIINACQGKAKRLPLIGKITILK